MAKGISLSSVTVSDIKKAKYLFVDLMGLTLKEFSEEYNWMEIGGEDQEARLGIGQACDASSDFEAIPAGSNAIISIDVDNIELTKKHLENHGIQFLQEIMEIPNEVKLALFKDSDGNRYFLCEKLHQRYKEKSIKGAFKLGNFSETLKFFSEIVKIINL